MPVQQYSYYQPRRQMRRPAPEPPKRSLRAFTVLVIFLVASVFILAVSHSSELLALAEDVGLIPKKVDVQQQLADKDIDDIVKANSQYTIGVSIQNITTGKLTQSGETGQFVAASTAKLITAVDYYHCVETGKYKLSKLLGAYNAGFQIKELVNQSDNDSWALLYDYMGHKQLSQYAASIGISNYNITDNKLTTADLASLLTKLYGGSLLNVTDTQQLLSYMQNTNYEYLIPAAVPSDITVYHKYGLVDGNLHDVSILVKGDEAYSLVIMTKSADDSDDDARTNVIHQITTAASKDLFS